MSTSPFRMYSWNVNGIRSCEKRGFGDWLKKSRANVVGLQEVRATPEQLSNELLKPGRWHSYFSPAERAGYSGVALYCREEPDELITSLGDNSFDAEGRVQIARFGALWIANIYFPNGSGKERDNSRVPYKLRFYKRLFDKLDDLRAKNGKVVVMGDFNTAHREIDLARPKSNQKTSGFLPEEREEFDRLLAEGWTDSFRHFNPDAEGHYTWWSQRFGVREKNIGWRIDYALVSKGVVPHMKKALIHPQTIGSDHCPISLELDRSALDVGTRRR
ncbi:MAG: exodeoxyribonuclease III [Polyangiales bacterium]